MVEGLTARLREGFSVLIFPEGTRSPRGTLHPFRRGAFRVAQEAGVGVQPLLVSCDPPVLGKDEPVWVLPAGKPTLTVKVLPSRDVTDPERDERELEDDFRRWIGHGVSKR